MAERQPTETTNLDIYGNAPLEWRRALNALSVPPEELLTWFLGTVDPDGRPHAAGVGALFIDGDVYLTSGPKTRKSRNLAANPACSVSVSLKGIDMVLEGEAKRVTDKETLERVVAVYKKGGWPAEVDGDAFTAPFSAPSAGPPPWYLYRFTFDTAVGVAGEEPHGATRWSFAS
jgi:Pyridoxamine 5'-phosphate oxidase